MLRTAARTTWRLSKLVDSWSHIATVQHLVETNYQLQQYTSVFRACSELIRGPTLYSGFSSSSGPPGGDSEGRNFSPRTPETSETPEESPSTQEGEEDKDGRVAASQVDSHLKADSFEEDLPEGSIRSLEEDDDFLERWSELLENDDFEGVRQLLEERLSNVGGVPPTEPDEFLAMPPLREEERAARRAHEMALQQEMARQRVRMVDLWGRAYATGKRKTSVARVWLWEGQGAMRINKKELECYFTDVGKRADVLSPFRVTGTLGQFDVMATVKGGGTSGQAQAIRHGISKALQLWEPEHRPALKAGGFLTRDPRIVERKSQAGRRLARHSNG